MFIEERFKRVMPELGLTRSIGDNSPVPHWLPFGARRPIQTRPGDTSPVKHWLPHYELHSDDKLINFYGLIAAALVVMLIFVSVLVYKNRGRGSSSDSPVVTSSSQAASTNYSSSGMDTNLGRENPLLTPRGLPTATRNLPPAIPTGGSK